MSGYRIDSSASWSPPLSPLGGGSRRFPFALKRTVRFLFLSLVLISMQAGALAQDAMARISIPKGDIWVGQRVSLVVELLAPGYFSGAPAFDLPEVSSLLLVPPSGSPVVASEEVRGMAYTVQRHEISMFAHRAGETTVSSITVRFRFKRNPLDKEAEEVSVKTETVRFQVKSPPGAEKVGSLISARELRVDEVWNPDPGSANLKMGDASTRIITFTAPDVPAMAFPPYRAGSIEGLGIYQKGAQILDHSERGSLTGERRDTIVYVCQRAGQFSLPAVKYVWWDLDSKELRTILLPARVFSVAPNSAIAAAAPSASPPWNRAFIAGWIEAIALNAAAYLAWRTRAVWNSFLEAIRPIHLSPLNPEPQGVRDLAQKRGDSFNLIS